MGPGWGVGFFAAYPAPFFPVPSRCAVIKHEVWPAARPPPAPVVVVRHTFFQGCQASAVTLSISSGSPGGNRHEINASFQGEIFRKEGGRDGDPVDCPIRLAAAAASAFRNPAPVLFSVFNSYS